MALLKAVYKGQGRSRFESVDNNRHPSSAASRGSKWKFLCFRPATSVDDTSQADNTFAERSNARWPAERHTQCSLVCWLVPLNPRGKPRAFRPLFLRLG